MAFTLKINGADHTVDVDGETPLLWTLRDVLGMTGTKFGCGQALCGACTVHLDGTAVRSCQTAIQDAVGMEVTTIRFEFPSRTVQALLYRTSVGIVPEFLRILEDYVDRTYPAPVEKVGV